MSELQQKERSRAARIRSNLRRRSDLAGPGFATGRGWIGKSYGIGTQDRRGDAIESVSRLQKRRDGVIAQTRKLREDGILIAELRESVGQQGDGGRGQTLLGRPPAVDFTQCE